ncbi:hypothetical protein GOBAR_AA25267 [Gossypium barbadense]|uniref:Uncharacterized protein n=1 Tax=Gossypium barbadense TaxID=3634 RepID=A0A2P5WWJ3_GOSBA|nr:hypothetical protein GOBAR_AA25267 [Gossypium barbadense]
MAFPRRGIGCSTKKVQRRLTEPLDPDDLVVDDKGMKVNPTNTAPISWKDKLMGDMANVMNTQKDENFDLQKGEAKNEIVDGIPSITFSERVYQLSQNVCLRGLLGMSCGMYTKILLKFIGSAIRLVVKIDRNTENNSKSQFVNLPVNVD